MSEFMFGISVVQPQMKHLFVALLFLIAPIAKSVGQSEASCGSGSPACMDSCGRFGKTDARFGACLEVCKRAGPEAATCSSTPTETVVKEAPHRAYIKKGDALRERELNGKMLKAIQQSDLREIRRLIEMNKGLDPTYVYDYDFDAATRQYEGRVVKLRLTDVMRDSVPPRRDEEGLDKILALFIELGMDVTATLPASDDPTSASTSARSAWGPSLVFMERAKDRAARVRAFDLALEKGLRPSTNGSDWLFAELPQVCGRDRSQFAIEIVDLLIKHLGTSLQDDLWRIGERGPETVADVLDRMMSPGTIPRSNFERTQFAEMDAAWENCSPLSRRLNRYLVEGK